MPRRRSEPDPITITDAAPSFDDEQRRRKRTYAILMVVHLVGFAAAGLLAHYWILALVIVAVTGVLPWVAVVIANDRSREQRRSHRIGRVRRALERGEQD